MSICLTPGDLEKIKEDLKKSGETFRPSDFRKLNGDEITKKLETITDPKRAKTLSTLLQEKSLLKDPNKALDLLRDKINEKGKYSPKMIERANREIANLKAKNLERILKPKDFQTELTDLAERITGQRLSTEENAKIFDMSKDIQKLQEKVGPGKTSIELDNEKVKLEKYINSLDERPQAKVIADSLAHIFKNLFLSPATVSKVTIVDTLNTLRDTLARRVASGKLSNPIDFDTRIQALKDTFNHAAKTDSHAILPLKTDLNDNNIFGTTKKSSLSSRGVSENFGGGIVKVKPGGVGEYVAKGLNIADTVLKTAIIDIGHKVPMGLNIIPNFIDATGFKAGDLAKTEIANGMSAKDIFLDAQNPEPQTIPGKIVRYQAQQEVFRSLNINSTFISDALVQLQRNLNAKGTDLEYLHLGDLTMPMVKVPTNVVVSAIEDAGGSVPKALYDIGKGVQTLKELTGKNTIETLSNPFERVNTKEGVEAANNIRNGYMNLVRVAGTATAAAIILNGLKKQDVQSDNYGNVYIKLGNHWLSTEIFGSGGAAVAGLAEAKFGKKSVAQDYATGAFYDPLNKAPIGDIPSLFSNIKQQKAVFPGAIQALFPSFSSPTLVKNIQKAQKEGTSAPVWLGTLIRTNAQLKQEEDVKQAKSVASRAANVKAKTQPRKFW